MLRIAQCTDSFLPISDGVGRVVFTYAQAIAACGHESYVIAPAVNDGFRGAYPFEIVDYLGVRLPGMGNAQYGVAAMDRHYVSRVDSIPFDLVHAHSPGSSGQEAARIAERLRIPMIGTFHPRYFDDLKRFIANPDLASAALRYAADFYTRCDEVWALTQRGVDTLREAGYQGRIEIMPNGMDLSPVDPGDIARVRRIFHLSDAPVLLSVGQISLQKNIGRVIEAAAVLKKQNVSFQLLFAGHGPDETEVRSLVREYGLQGTVRFLGQITDQRLLRALYAAAALFVFPAPYSTSGLVVHEAAAVGTPSVVFSDSAAAESIVSGENGLLCQNDASALAGLIADWLETPERLHALGQAARESIPHPWPEVMQNVTARYEALAGREKYALKRKRGLFRRELGAMDESLEMRALELAGRFIKNDVQNLYSYPYKPQRIRRFPQRTETRLPRATPESQGVPSAALETFYRSVAADDIAQAHTVLVLRHGKIIGEGVWAPYEKGLTHELYSLSKSVTSTAIGMLVDEGRLDLDERLISIFPDNAPQNPLHPVCKMTVRHLLTMSTGSEFNEVGSALGADWEKEFMNAGVKFEPGTNFDYNSMNTYMLSAIVRKRTGQSLSEYLHPRLFAPLGIKNAPWAACPKGTEKGGWGLSLTCENVAKIGQLYLNGGVWNVNGVETRLLSESWVQEATRVEIETPNGELTYGYGYQIWRTPHPGGYMFNGMFGQYMIALPDRDAIVAVLSGTPLLFAHGNMMAHVDRLLDTFSDEPLPEDAAAQSSLCALTAGLSCAGRAPLSMNLAEMPAEELIARLDGKVYTFSENILGLYPMMLQCVRNNFSTGVQHVVFKRAGSRMTVEFDEGKTANTLTLDPGGYARGVISMRGEVQQIASSMQTGKNDRGEPVLRVCIHFLETPYTRLLTFTFTDDTVSLVGDECPSIRDASSMVLEIAGLTRQQAFRSILPLLKRDSLQNRLRTVTTVKAEGKL